MLEYGIKAIITNPTLITKATEIIRLVDSRSNKTRAFVLPVYYEEIVEKIVKEIKYKQWVKEKKERLATEKNQKESFDDIMDLGIDSTNIYLKDS
ncbi:hypothetical protein KKC13_09660 [bacterium]|nr:hypothetical protein [bacterium]MBU1958119.1 hypothetical protein [bacterium]